MKAVIDHFEGDLAVLILLDEYQRLNIPIMQLPFKAKEGSWLTLDLVGGQPCNIKLYKQETESIRERIAAKLANLRKGDDK